MAEMLKVTGAEEFQAKLKQVLERAPDRVEEKLEGLGRELRNRARERTPEGPTGKLKKSYKLSPPEPIPEGGFQITMTNTSPHFHLIERGHRLVSRNGVEKGFVPGKFMVETSVKEMEEEVPEELGEWLDDLFKELVK